MAATRWRRNSVRCMFQQILQGQEKIMAAIDDLTSADTSLQGVVSKVLADFAAAIQAAQGDPAKIEQVVTDMNNMASQLTGADPANAQPTPAPAPAPNPAPPASS